MIFEEMQCYQRFEEKSYFLRNLGETSYIKDGNLKT